MKKINKCMNECIQQRMNKQWLIQPNKWQKLTPIQHLLWSIDDNWAYNRIIYDIIIYNRIVLSFHLL